MGWGTQSGTSTVLMTAASSTGWTESPCCPVKTVTGKDPNDNEAPHFSTLISGGRVRGVRGGLLPGGEGGLAGDHHGVPGHLQVQGHHNLLSSQGFIGKTSVFTTKLALRTSSASSPERETRVRPSLSAQ